MNGCLCHANFLAAERQTLSVAIAADQLYLSQLAGYQVGHTTAEQHFRDHLLRQFAERFRADYCRGCWRRDRCRVCPLEKARRPGIWPES